MPTDPNSAQPLSDLPNAGEAANAIAPLFSTQAMTGKQGTKKLSFSKCRLRESFISQRMNHSTIVYGFKS